MPSHLGTGQLQYAIGCYVSSPYLHVNSLHEVMVGAPVASAQLSAISKRCDVEIDSIDHIAKAFLNEFTDDLAKYLVWKEAKD